MVKTEPRSGPLAVIMHASQEESNIICYAIFANGYAIVRPGENYVTNLWPFKQFCYINLKQITLRLLE